MMHKFSKTSLDRVKTCHPDLQRVIHASMQLQVMDFTVICGVRTLEEQKRLVAEGKSKTMRSKHLAQSDGYSHAIDIAPYPINWNDRGAFYMLAGIVKAVATIEGVKLRYGGDWDGDNQTTDQTFHDLPHFELVDA